VAGPVIRHIVIAISTEIVIRVGEHLVHQLIGPDEVPTGPVLHIRHTNAGGALVSTTYQVDQADAISVNAIEGDVVISGNGRVRSVTVAAGSTATIEIVAAKGDRAVEVTIEESQARPGGPPAAATTPRAPPVGAASNQPAAPPRKTRVTLTPLEAKFALGWPAAIRFSGMPGGSGDWIGVAVPGAADTTYLQSQYTSGATSGIVTFADLPAGRYEARAYFDNAYVRQASATFSVGGSRTTVAVSAKRYPAGAPVVVSFNGMPGNPSDWIGIAAPGSADTAYVTYQFTDGFSSGTLTFSNLQAGTYEARAYFNSGYVRLATSIQFEVDASG